MAKIDYTKVENSLKEWALKLNVKELLYLADLASASFGMPKLEGEEGREASSSKTAEALAAALKAMQADLTRLRKKDASMYEKLGVDQQEVQHYFEHPENLSPKDWEGIKAIRDKIEAYKKEMRRKMKGVSDQDIVQEERKKQKTKRFNIKDDWIPLQ